MTESEDQAQDQRPSGRPAPEYGEYAPDGWTPPGANDHTGGGSTRGAGTRAERTRGEDAQGSSTDHAGDAHTAGDAVDPAGAPPTGTGHGNDGRAPAPRGRVPGVPHNLGVSSGTATSSTATSGTAASNTTPPNTAAPGAQTDASRQAPTAPPPSYGQLGSPPTDGSRAPEQPPAPGSPAPPPQQRGAGSGTGRRADRIITILLLVFGALGALYLAASLQQLPASLELFSTALGADGLVIPAAVHTLGTVGALTILAIYALNLVFSIQRLRARRLTFWVPLAAGVIAFVVFFAITAFAMNQAPEVMQLFTDPDALSKLLAYLSEPQP